MRANSRTSSKPTPWQKIFSVDFRVWLGRISKVMAYDSDETRACVVDKSPIQENGTWKMSLLALNLILQKGEVGKTKYSLLSPDFQVTQLCLDEKAWGIYSKP
jgi:hypothetical protein